MESVKLSGERMDPVFLVNQIRPFEPSYCTLIGTALSRQAANDVRVGLLLEAAANIDGKNESGETALHREARNGNDAVVLLPLEEKANLKLSNDSKFLCMPFAG